MSRVRGAPMHQQTHGKIERWHQALKNRILLENYFLPGDLEAQLKAFIEHYNQRYHESPSNVTPADTCFGRAPAIIKRRGGINCGQERAFAWDGKQFLLIEEQDMIDALKAPPTTSILFFRTYEIILSDCF